MQSLRASDRALGELKDASAIVAAYQIAGVHAQRGEKDQAIAELDTALQSQSPNLEQLPTDPFLDPLRSDPRFEALSNKLNFPGGA